MSVPRCQVEVLVEGYARLVPIGGWVATSTCTLITAPPATRIVVDPGCNRELVLTRLAEHGVRPEDVSVVFLTHHHLDHTMNVALFPFAVVVDHEAVYRGDRATPVENTILDTAIEILQTPGHTADHASLAVPTAGGVVVIAGDAFWWMEGEEQVLDVDGPDVFATDMDRLRASRRMLLRIADWIIPGHGGRQRAKR